MSDLNITYLPGDGVGPEVTAVAKRAVHVVSDVFGHRVVSREAAIGWAASVAHGISLPEETLQACQEADAVFLGAVGDPAAEGAPAEKRPETGLLALRKALECFANLRPIKVDDALVGGSALKEDRVKGTDILIVRELIGGIYFGSPRGREPSEMGERAFDTMTYARGEVERIAHVAFQAAEKRGSRVTSIEKANVLESSRLWRETVTSVATEYPSVTLSHMLIDRAAMEMVIRPTQFDVILTGNLFGDILSDEGAALTGSLGTLGSASVGTGTGLYEPVHGSAPDIAGTDSANPIGALRSAALMLKHGFGLNEEAEFVEAAISTVLDTGLRTADLSGQGGTPVGTRAFGDAVCEALIQAGKAGVS